MTGIATEASPVRGMFARVYRDILTNRAQLPTMPHVALRLRAAMQKKNFSVDSVARAIEADPGTSAYLIRIANSALYRGVVPIQNVNTAVSRFGMQATRNLVTAYALRAMFTTRSRALARIMQDTWRTSARVAALSSILAKRCPDFVPDQAMLAGLLQDIGVLPLLNAIEQRKQPVTDAASIVATLGSYANKVGPVLLEHWGFDEATIEVARSRDDWFRDPGPAADLADLVLIARLHAGVGDAGQHEQPRINEVPAFGRLGLDGLGPDESLQMLTDAEADVRDLMRMLGV